MSSHHFVRAEQADCLVVVNQNINDDLFNQLLEWNPVIVATDKTLQWLNSLDIKVDVLLSNQTENDFPYPIEIINQTDIIAAIDLLENQLKVARITVIGNENLEQIQQHILSLRNKNISIIESSFKHCFLEENKIFKKWMAKGTRWYCYPYNAIKTEGNIEVKEGGFIVTEDSKVTIHILKNIIFKESI